jgi:hypothetical protein
MSLHAEQYKMEENDWEYTTAAFKIQRSFYETFNLASQLRLNLNLNHL